MSSEDLFAGVLPFFHTAEELSFRRSAERLGISAAAVSKSVQKLEERLGVKLLVRTSRSVRLTPEGALYQERCREAIASLVAGRELMSQSRRQPRGEVNVTLSMILGRIVVPALPRLTSRYPNLEVRLTMTDQLSALARESLDVAVRIGARADSSLLSRRLLSPRWVTVGAPSYLARRGAPSGPEELGRYNALRYVGPNGKPRGWTFADPVTGGLTQHEVSGNLRVDHGDHLVDAAIAGLGLAQVLDFMVAEPLRDGRLERVLVTFEAPGPQVHAVSTPERWKTPNVRAFVTFLQDVFSAAGSPDR